MEDGTMSPSPLKKAFSARIPKRIRQELSSPPHRGQGLHQWLFVMSLKLSAYRTPEEIIHLLDKATEREPVSASEIYKSVENATRSIPKTGQLVRLNPNRLKSFPPVNLEQRESIIINGGGLEDLWEKSPIQFTDAKPHTEEIIETLFPSDPLLCCGWSSSRFATNERSRWKDLSGLQLIVPSPMSAPTGVTKEGKISAHSLDNTGPRRFLIVEQDQGTLDEQSSILLHLAQKAPLALAVHSGSKSIHGWFFCSNQTEEELRSFMGYAISLGADKATWTRSQFVRMPDGLRDNGSRQTVYFFNPPVIS
jgi:hypothetical protein